MTCVDFGFGVQQLVSSHLFPQVAHQAFVYCRDAVLLPSLISQSLVELAVSQRIRHKRVSYLMLQYFCLIHHTTRADYQTVPQLLLYSVRTSSFPA